MMSPTFENYFQKRVRCYSNFLILLDRVANVPALEKKRALLQIIYVVVLVPIVQPI
jgi:hypothetical protein